MNRTKSLTLPDTMHRFKIQDSCPTYYTYSSSGYMDSIIWEKSMKLFSSLLRDKCPIGRAIVFTDRPSSHLGRDAISHLMEKDINLIALPANTTTFLQPLDSTPFAVFKQISGQLSRDAMVGGMMTKRPLRDIALIIAQEASNKSFTSEVIKSGFSDVGLVPWDKNKIIQNAELQLSKKLTSDKAPEKVPDPFTEMAQKMHDVMETMFQVPPGRKARVKVVPGDVFTGEEIIEAQLAHEAAKAAESKKPSKKRKTTKKVKKPAKQIDSSNEEEGEDSGLSDVY